MKIERVSGETSETDEVRWAVLALEGGHHWLGRSEPTEGEMEEVRRLASAHKRALWFVRVAGDYYSQKPLIVTLWGYMNLGGEGTFEDAVLAFRNLRNRMLSQYMGVRNDASFPEVIARREPDRMRSPFFSPSP